MSTNTYLSTAIQTKQTSQFLALKKQTRTGKYNVSRHRNNKNIRVPEGMYYGLCCDFKNCTSIVYCSFKFITRHSVHDMSSETCRFHGHFTKTVVLNLCDEKWDF